MILRVLLELYDKFWNHIFYFRMKYLVYPTALPRRRSMPRPLGVVDSLFIFSSAFIACRCFASCSRFMDSRLIRPEPFSIQHSMLDVRCLFFYCLLPFPFISAFCLCAFCLSFAYLTIVVRSHIGRKMARAKKPITAARPTVSMGPMASDIFFMEYSTSVS